MKLRNLNGAVRKAADKVIVTMIAPDGRPIIFRVPRNAVVEGLNEAWDKEGMTETGLTIDDDGRLIPDFVETEQDRVLEDAMNTVEPDDEDLAFGGDGPVVAPTYDDDDLLG